MSVKDRPIAPSPPCFPAELVLQEEKQEKRRNTLAAVADELVSQEQRQNKQRQKLAEYVSDLEKVEIVILESLIVDKDLFSLVAVRSYEQA